MIDKEIKNYAFIDSQKRYLVLLKRFPSEYMAFVSDLRNKMEYIKEKNPVRTKPYRALFVVILI